MGKNAKPSAPGKKGQSAPSVTGSAANASKPDEVKSTVSPGQPSTPGDSMNAGSGVDELGQGSGNNDGAGQLEENTGNYADAEKPEALNLAGQAETAVASRDDGTVACVIVAAKTDGFRRAGRAWSTKPRAIPQVHFTDEELAALCNDPHLIVSAGQVPADKVEHHV